MHGNEIDDKTKSYKKTKSALQQRNETPIKTYRGVQMFLLCLADVRSSKQIIIYKVEQREILL